MTRKLLLLICFFNALNISAEIYSGSCGENVKYSLDTETGVRSITGTGAMTNYSTYKNTPWYEQRLDITSIDITEGVTAIGKINFQYCSNLTSVTIPNSVTSIGEYSFEYCSGLTSIEIPNSVTTIGKYAFYGCDGLNSVLLSNNLNVIDDYTFCGCKLLTSVDIPNGVTTIKDRAFSGCLGLTNVTIPSSVKSIGNYSFFGCLSLSSVTIPNSVTSIGTMGFFGSGISKVILHSNAITSKSYTTNSTLKDIFGQPAKEYVLGEEITSIGSYAFQNCTEVTGLYCYAENVPNADATAFNNLDLSNDTLYVHASSLEAYQATSPWNQFGTIMALEDLEPATVRGDVNGDGKVDMDDVKYLVQKILNGKFPDEE